MSVQIKETIRHGDYHHERIATVPALIPTEIAVLLDGSPYRPAVALTADDGQVQTLTSDLAAGKVGAIGWANYEVVA